MFDNVGRGAERQRKRQVGAFLLSLVLNGTAMGGLVWAGARVVEEVAAEPEIIEVPIELAAPAPPAAGGSKPVVKKKVTVQSAPADQTVEPTLLPEPTVAETDVESDVVGIDDSVGPGVEGGVVGGINDGVNDGVIGGAPTGDRGAGLKSVYWGAVREKNRVQPQFPAAATAANIEGDCNVTIEVDAKGVPTRASANVCPEVFREAAIQAALASRFYPYKDAGTAIAVQFRYSYRFRAK